MELAMDEIYVDEEGKELNLEEFEGAKGEDDE